MFNDLSGGVWMVIVVGLMLGFGIIRWVVSVIEDKAGERAQSSNKRSSQGDNHQDHVFSSDHEPNKTSKEGPRKTNSIDMAWYEVLGVDPLASPDEIRLAYKRKMSLYHPDKVASLGEEFMEIAVIKSKEINVAYEQAMAQRSSG